jgi:hypothetical protein
MPTFQTNASVDIYRLVTASAKEQYSATPVLTNLSAGIWPVSTDILAVMPGESAYQLYDCYIFSKQAIQNGDKIIDADGAEYIVKGTPYVMNSTYLVYTKLLLEKVV